MVAVANTSWIIVLSRWVLWPGFAYPAGTVFAFGGLAGLTSFSIAFFVNRRRLDRADPDQLAAWMQLSARWVSSAGWERFLDRIDLRIDVPAVSAADMIGPATAEPSAAVAARVGTARERQRQRYVEAGHPDIFTNAGAGPSLIEKLVNPDKESQTLLLQAAERFNLSARAYHRVLKVARTLADLAGAEKVGRPHLAEALSYRLNMAMA